MKTLLVSLFGLTTTILTIVLLVWLEMHHWISIYNYMFLFVIPVGAIGCGLLSNSGYLLGARLFNHRPSPVLFSLILLFSVDELFLIQWLEYALIDINGTPISYFVPFNSYLNFMFSHKFVTLYFSGKMIRDTFLFGARGYLYTLLQILGFVLGSVSIYAYMRSLAACEQCSCLLGKEWKQTRYFKNEAEMRSSADAIIAAESNSNLQDLISMHARTGSTDCEGAIAQSTIKVLRCKGCGKNWLCFSAKQKSNRKWKAIASMKHTGHPAGQLC